MIELPPDALAQIAASTADTVAGFWPVAALVAGILLAFGIAGYLLELIAGGGKRGIETTRTLENEIYDPDDDDEEELPEQDKDKENY